MMRFVESSLRANGSRESAPDDRLREAIQSRKSRRGPLKAGTQLAMMHFNLISSRSRSLLKLPCLMSEWIKSGLTGQGGRSA
jgi:hypothetical protein